MTTQLHNPKNWSGHYIQEISVGKTIEEPTLLLIVREALKPGLFHDKYLADIQKWDGKPISGKILLLLPKDSISTVSPGTILGISSKLESIPSPLHPYQFNYRKFMEHCGVFRQINTSKPNFIVFRPQKFRFQRMLASWREHIISQL